MKKFVLGITVIVAVITGLHAIDDYYGDKACTWFKAEQNRCFDRYREPHNASLLPADIAVYLAVWRVLNNVCPTLSEALAPSPKFGSSEPIEAITAQEYYYDSWAGRIIRVSDEDTEEL